jgi:hypothetical protein
MKKFLFLLAFIQTIFPLQGQDSRGKIIVEKINSAALQNTGGENPVRSVTIYLPLALPIVIALLSILTI